MTELAEGKLVSCTVQQSSGYHEAGFLFIGHLWIFLMCSFLISSCDESTLPLDFLCVCMCAVELKVHGTAEQSGIIKEKMKVTLLQSNFCKPKEVRFRS